MIIGIVLNKEISCESICAHVQDLVNKHRLTTPDLSSSILTIEIKNMVDAGDHHIPKITYEDFSSPT
jgi:hypothetical protein